MYVHNAIEEVMEKAQKSIALNLLKKGMSTLEIYNLTELNIDDIN